MINEPFRIEFNLNGEQLYLQDNFNARAYLKKMCPSVLERNSVADWTLEEIMHYLRALLMDSKFEENKDFISERKFNRVVPSLAEIGRNIDAVGAGQIVMQILNAVSGAMPTAPVTEDENFTKGGQTAAPI